MIICNNALVKFKKKKIFFLLNLLVRQIKLKMYVYGVYRRWATGFLILYHSNTFAKNTYLPTKIFFISLKYFVNNYFFIYL